MANAHEYDDNNENDAPSSALPDFRPPELRQASVAAAAPEAPGSAEGVISGPSAPEAAAATAAEEEGWQESIEALMKLDPELKVTPEGAAAFQAGLRGEAFPPVAGEGAADAQRAYGLGRQEREAQAGAEIELGGSAGVEAEIAPGLEEETVSISKADLDVLMAVAAKVQKTNEGPEVNQEDLDRVNRIVTRQASPISDQVSENVQSAITTGGQAVAGLVRGTLGGVRNLLMGAKPGDRAPDAANVAARAPHLFPRLSDYRVVQLEKNVREYGEAVDTFWGTGPMPDVRKAIEERARTSGLSVEDVMEKMKPNGEYADLHQRFVEAVGSSSEAQDRRKAMNKAIDGFVRQYSSAQEELIAPYEDGNPHYDKLKQRVGDAREQMLKKAGTMPRFEGDKESHLERLKEMIQKIMDKVREAASGIAAILRGKSNSAEVSNEPAP